MPKPLSTAITLSTLLILSSLLAFAGTVNFAQAANAIQVPSATYPTIQSALNAATNGTVINVASGTYNENVNCPYSYLWGNHSDITLQGSSGTTINGNVMLNGFTVLKMDNFVITGSLSVGNSREGLVQNSAFSNIQAQTIIFYAMHTTFSHLTVTNILTISGGYNSVTDSKLNTVKLGESSSGAGYLVIENTIASNTISGGITCPQAINTKIVGNTINGAAVGITETPYKASSSGAGGLTIFDNTITNCGVGISLWNSQYFHSSANVTQNTISNNAVGIEIQAGPFPSASTTIYKNSFINNGIQANVSRDTPNNWSYGNPAHGNFWSDYKGTDANSDGIGDSPYIINANNTDNYPIVHTQPQPTATPTPTPNPPQPTTDPTPTPTTTPTSNPTNDPPAPTATPTSNTQPTQSPTTQPAATANPTSNPASDKTIPEINPALFVLLIALLTLPILAIKLSKTKERKQ